MNVEAERKLARQQLEVFRKRYAPHDDMYLPIALAVQWERAVSEDPCDLQAMKAVVDAAVPRKNDFGMNFFGFCNHAERITKEEIRRSFEIPPTV